MHSPWPRLWSQISERLASCGGTSTKSVNVFEETRSFWIWPEFIRTLHTRTLRWEMLWPARSRLQAASNGATSWAPSSHFPTLAMSTCGIRCLRRLPGLTSQRPPTLSAHAWVPRVTCLQASPLSWRSFGFLSTACSEALLPGSSSFTSRSEKRFLPECWLIEWGAGRGVFGFGEEVLYARRASAGACDGCLQRGGSTFCSPDASDPVTQVQCLCDKYIYVITTLDDWRVEVSTPVEVTTPAEVL